MLEDVTIFYIRTDVFKYSFFLSPSTILERNKLDRRIRQSATVLSFRNTLLKIGRPTPKPVYNKHDPNGLKSLLTRLSLGLPISFPFFLHCHYFPYLRKTLFNELQSVNVDENILISLSNNETVELLLYGSNKFKFQRNYSILKSPIKFTIKSEKFSGSFV